MKIKDRNQKPTREKQYNESISENRQLLVLPSQDDLGPFNLIGTHCKNKYPTKKFLKNLLEDMKIKLRCPHLVPSDALLEVK